MKLVFIGLSLSSSWGNGHATTYRSLLRALRARGHEILFLERNQPWYAANRDLADPSFCRLAYYDSVADLKRGFGAAIREASGVIVGSYVPEGDEIGDWVVRQARGQVAFYDIDTPVTLELLEAGTCPYLRRASIPRYDLYLSFTGGALLERLERDYGARRAVAFHCSADLALASRPPRVAPEPRFALGYLGTYSADRQPALERLLLGPARQWPEHRFAVVGAQYPRGLRWPDNVIRQEHLEPKHHGEFYGSQRFTLNVTRAAMIRAGYSPSVRLFEAAACGTAIITDAWTGLESFFTPGSEILVAKRRGEVCTILRELPESERRAIGGRARARFLREHTPAHRAAQFEGLLGSLSEGLRSGTGEERVPPVTQPVRQPEELAA